MRRFISRVFLIGVSVSSAYFSRPPVAAAAERALAEELYNEGRALMAKGLTAEACVKFEESQRLEAASGALLNLAVCHEKLGQIATAWAEFRASEARAIHDRRPDRARLAREHIAGLEPRVSHLTVVVLAEARVPGLTITLDQTALEQPSWNAPLPIDPGDHLVTARAAGFSAWSARITVRPTAEQLSVVVSPVPLAPRDEAQVALSTEPRPQSVTESTSPISPSPSDRAKPRSSRTAALALLGLGGAGLVLGGIFGARAFSRWDASNGECPNNVCSTTGVRLANEAGNAAVVSDIAFGVGVAALAVSGYLLQAARGKARAETTPAAGQGRAWKIRVAPTVVSRGLAVDVNW